MSDYSRLPAGVTLDVKPFKVHVEEEKLHHFKKLLELSPVGPSVFENTEAGRRYGMETMLENAKKVWLNDFDWRKHEDRINSYPNFKATVNDRNGHATDVHIMALFSENPDAIPIAFFHGWPGSFCDFFEILDLLRQKYTAAELPYHIIVPSLPGYAYSSGPPVDSDYGVDVAADAMHKLMIGLGFDKGYLVHGGDLGSFVARILALTYDECKGMHVSMMTLPPLDNPDVSQMDDQQKSALGRAKEFVDTSYAFALEQGTRSATIGLALSSSPLALLAWVGEKLLAWTDEDPPLEKVLESVTLYWVTDTISRSFYHNRGMGDPSEEPTMARISVLTSMAAIKMPFVNKPCGYSKFYEEIVPIPENWAAQACNLVSFAEHEKGGHFPAIEEPEKLLNDVEEYVRKAWKA